MPEQEIGVVTHYFDHPHVAVVSITAGEIKLGDTLHFRGHTTEFAEPVDSMEMDHGAVERAGAGEEVAIRVVGRTRKQDKVFLVTPD